MTNLKQLEQEKANIEYTMKQLQDQLDVVNQLIAEETTKTINNISKKFVSIVKKAKLSPTQEKVMQSLHNAIPYYQDLSTKRVTSYGNVLYNPISTMTYINGENIKTHWSEENQRFENRTQSYIMGNNRYAHEMDTKTLNALEKKGYVKIIEVGGNTLDLVELVDNIEQPEIYTELVKMQLSYKYYSAFSEKELIQKDTIYCPIGQETQALEAYKKDLRDSSLIVKIDSQEVVPVDTWKF